MGKHKDARFGTHHARDAWHLFNTMGYDLNLFSSAIKLNTQYMHIDLLRHPGQEPDDDGELLQHIKRNDRMAITYKSSANTVFSFGRDYGHFGRILNVTVVVGRR